MRLPVWRRRLAILLDRQWTQLLPIYTYLIEHDEGLILLDSGESARSSAPGWFPWWNPVFQVIPVDGRLPGLGRRAAPGPQQAAPITEDMK
jgi:hypothetical protein